MNYISLCEQRSGFMDEVETTTHNYNVEIMFVDLYRKALPQEIKNVINCLRKEVKYCCGSSTSFNLKMCGGVGNCEM